ncbi:MAG TPA: hypothetical protein DEQ14_08775 [Treponema sp.]|nr:hypothetical protein [Treponema sp.]
MVKLFVEGGGDSKSLHTECRKAFSTFLEKAGLKDCMPRIVACGSRNNAFDDYCTAIENGESAVLLVDSEAPVIIDPNMSEEEKTDIKKWKPWYHLKKHKNQAGYPTDNWNAPKNAKDTDCHLMVEVMETWFLADVEAIKKYYANKFTENSLLKRPDIEKVSKKEIISSLCDATKNTEKGSYSKGRHSFDILALIDPEKVKNRSPWAKRFIELLTEKMKQAR